MPAVISAAARKPVCPAKIVAIVAGDIISPNRQNGWREHVVQTTHMNNARLPSINKRYPISYCTRHSGQTMKANIGGYGNGYFSPGSIPSAIWRACVKP